MNKKFLFAIIFIASLAVHSMAFAQVYIPNPLRYNNFPDLLTNGILPAVAGIVGSLSVIMIIVSGIMYLTSAGNPEKINTAKKALTYAIFGIIITLSAGILVVAIRTALGG